MLDLRLRLQHAKVITQQYDASIAQLAGSVACELVREVKMALERWPTSRYLNTISPTLLLSPVVVLCVLLIEQPPSVGGAHVATETTELCEPPTPVSSPKSIQEYLAHFNQAITILTDLSRDSPVAARVRSQVRNLVRLTISTFPRSTTGPAPASPIYGPNDLASLFDFDGQLAHEINGLIQAWCFPEAGCCSVEFWAPVCGRPPEEPDAAWDILFVSSGRDSLPSR